LMVLTFQNTKRYIIKNPEYITLETITVGTVIIEFLELKQKILLYCSLKTEFKLPIRILYMTSWISNIIEDYRGFCQ
jgi:hypothetical protein